MPNHLDPPGHAALRRGRYSESGRSYLVTAATDRRTPHFLDGAAAASVSRIASTDGVFLDANLLAWVLMPDHWHGLIELKQADLSRVIQRFKSTSAHTLRRQRRSLGRIWARGFHDHALRANEDLLHCARYIIMNPVRAGLVTRVGDYPYWNAIWL